MQLHKQSPSSNICKFSGTDPVLPLNYLCFCATSSQACKLETSFPRQFTQNSGFSTIPLLIKVQNGHRMKLLTVLDVCDPIWTYSVRALVRRSRNSGGGCQPPVSLCEYHDGRLLDGPEDRSAPRSEPRLETVAHEASLASRAQLRLQLCRHRRSPKRIYLLRINQTLPVLAFM